MFSGTNSKRRNESSDYVNSLIHKTIKELDHEKFSLTFILNHFHFSESIHCSDNLQ